MSRQEFGPFSFESPSQWSRRAILVFVGESEDPAAPPNIVVAREQRTPDEELQTHAFRRVFEVARGLTDFELLGSHATTIDGQQAFKAMFRWSSEHGPVEQAIAWIDSREGNALTITCTSINKPESFDQFEHMLASVRLGARDSMVVPAAPSTPHYASSPPPPLESHGNYGAVPMPGARPARR